MDIPPEVWCKGGVKGLVDQRTGGEIVEFQILSDSIGDLG
jgi:hypothetical protein